MHDLVIRKGLIVDGTGAPAFAADVAIDDGKITQVGEVSAKGREEIDANGAIVTPGFVDIHCHYDGQATWDSALEPSSQHGVTTLLNGNCGVGFAPVRPGDDAKRQLIELMEGVEDIPGTALWEGMDWRWESFPEYLDVLDERSYAIDIATLIPHGSLRSYVMGQRGINHEAATEDDMAKMSSLVAEAVSAGAFGFSSSRVLGHQSIDGNPVPGTFAGDDELVTIGRVVAENGGLFQLLPGGLLGSAGVAVFEQEGTPEAKFEDEIKWMGSLSRETGMTLTFLIAETHENPEFWRTALDWTDKENDKGANLRPQVGARPQCVLISFEGNHMFKFRPTFKTIAGLPFSELVKELQKPEIKAAILSEADEIDSSFYMDQLALGLGKRLSDTYPLVEPLDYEPTADKSVAATAERLGMEPQELAYDLMLRDEGRGLLMLFTLNYAKGNADALHELLMRPDIHVGLGDGGAHCTATIDGTIPTYMLSHWARDRERGPRLPLEMVVRKQTADNAALLGLDDRGVIAVGKRADLNVIDLDRLHLKVPRMVYDLPAGGMRLSQKASGYLATIVAGTIVRRNDEDTGARPGRLLRRGANALA